MKKNKTTQFSIKIIIQFGFNEIELYVIMLTFSLEITYRAKGLPLSNLDLGS